MKKNQLGFSHVALLLALIAVAVIAFGGWYVWSKQKNRTNEQEVVTRPGSQEGSQTDERDKSVSETQYFTIEQFGVKFATNQSLKQLYYVIGNDGKTAYFSLEDLKNTECAADKTSQYALTRYSEQDLQSEQLPYEPTAALIRQEGKKLGDYYYFTMKGQSACSNVSAIQDQADTLRQELQKVLPADLQPIQ